MNNENRTGIQISGDSTKQEISVVGKGIQIRASEKPIASIFGGNWGWLYILLDCSGSMKERRKLEQAKVGITKFAEDAFIKQYRIGIIKFGDQAEHIIEPTNNMDELQTAIKDIQAFGWTNMTAAIQIAHAKLKVFSGTKVIVVATDGMPDNVKTSLEAAAKAKADGIDILTIGTDDAEKEFLQKIASRTELSVKVASERFGLAISGASLLLSGPKSVKPK